MDRYAREDNQRATSILDNIRTALNSGPAPRSLAGCRGAARGRYLYLARQRPDDRGRAVRAAGRILETGQAQITVPTPAGGLFNLRIQSRTPGRLIIDK
jgi:hypothetical protein